MGGFVTLGGSETLCLCAKMFVTTYVTSVSKLTENKIIAIFDQRCYYCFAASGAQVHGAADRLQM
ncbi:hypothetical protein BH10CHL1_BH10CHL1_31040 [soil metagenome]